MYKSHRTRTDVEPELNMVEGSEFEYEEPQFEEEEEELELFSETEEMEFGSEFEDTEYESPPTTVPTPGRFYAIQYGKGGLLTTTGRAYGVGAGAERLRLAQSVNNHPRNRNFWVKPANDYEKRYFPNGIISFNPMFTCGRDQRPAAKTDRKCFARVWIPPRGGPKPRPSKEPTCGVPEISILGEIEQELEIQQLKKTAQKAPAVRPRLCLFQNVSNNNAHRNHFQCGALRQARRIGAVGSPTATQCPRRVGATPYDTGADVIRLIEATHGCLGDRAVDAVHIFSHGFDGGVVGNGSNVGLYRNSYSPDRGAGGRTASDVPTAPLANNVMFVLHGCNTASGNDNLALSLYQHLAGSLSSPRVYGHRTSGCAGRNSSWREYSNGHPTGRNLASLSGIASTGCCSA